MTTTRPIYVRISRIDEIVSGLSRATVYRLAKRGELTIHKRGAGSFIKVSDVEDYIEGRTGR